MVVTLFCCPSLSFFQSFQVCAFRTSDKIICNIVLPLHCTVLEYVQYMLSLQYTVREHVPRICCLYNLPA